VTPEEPELEPYRPRADTLEPEAKTTEMHAAELAALAEYDEARPADTEVTGPPDGAHMQVRPAARTIPWSAEVNDSAEAATASIGGQSRRGISTLLGVALGAVVGLGAGFGLGAASTDREVDGPTPDPAPSASAPPPVEDDLSAVRSGAPEALDALAHEAAVDRSSAQTLALAEGRSRAKLHALELLAAELEAHPAAAQQRRLMDFIRDRETTVAAARVAAKLAGPEGPDVLYAVWVGTRERDETTMLAEDLVYSTDVRRKASPALAVALDLRLAKSCEDYLSVLPRAVQHGDRRSAHLLGELTRASGCGPNGTDDCYACLRPLDRDPGTVGLRDALRAVALRPAPEID
jgi:hypothetical protein